jgi:hypothetical protein
MRQYILNEYLLNSDDLEAARKDIFTHLIGAETMGRRERVSEDESNILHFHDEGNGSCTIRMTSKNYSFNPCAATYQGDSDPKNKRVCVEVSYIKNGLFSRGPSSVTGYLKKHHNAFLVSAAYRSKPFDMIIVRDKVPYNYSTLT